MKFTAKLFTAATAVCLTLGFAAANADYDISVRMDGVTSDGSAYVEFGDIKPVQLESRTLIPARDIAESAGLDVMWDQPTQTAILTLTADAYSDMPIERFAARVINSIDTPAIDLVPVDISAALKLDSSTAIIRYNFRDPEGDYVALGKEYDMVSKTILIDDGTLMLPIRDSMEMFGLNVGWNQDDLCAYVSIPETPSIPGDLRIISNPGEGEFAPTAENEKEYRSYNYQNLLDGGDGLSYDDEYDSEDEFLGVFKITHYCPCNICNGGWGATTAWAGPIIPGQTVAVNTNDIAPLEWIYIDGYGIRRAEDTGSGVLPGTIDVAVPTHAMVKAMSVTYKDVYRVKR